MRTRITALASALLLLIASSILAQEAPASEQIAAELGSLKKAEDALKAEDLDAAATLLGVPTLSAEERQDWLTAIAERRTALEGLSRVRTLSVAIPATREISDRQREAERSLASLERQITINTERPLPPDLTQEKLSGYEAGLRELTSRRQVAAERLAARTTEVEGVRRDLPAFESRIASLKTGLAQPEPDAADLKGKFRWETQLRSFQYHEAWIGYARFLTESSSELLAVLEIENQVLKGQLEREESFVNRVAKRLQDSHRMKARKLDRDVEKATRRAEDPSTDAEERARLLADIEILKQKAETERTLEYLQQAKTLLRNEQALNDDLNETRTWIESRFGASGSVSNRTSSLLVKALDRVSESRRTLERELAPDLAEKLEKYLTDEAVVDDELREIRRDEEKESLRKALKDRREQIGQVLPVLRQIDGIYSARETQLDETYTYILRRIYWAHSDEPLGIESFKTLGKELGRVGSLLFGQPTREEAWAVARSGDGHFYAVVGGSALLFLLGLGIPGLLRRRSGRWKFRGGVFAVLLQRILAIILLSALAPLSLLAAARLLQTLSLPAIWIRPSLQLLVGLAVILFLRRICWAFTQEGGVLESSLKLPTDSIRQIGKSGRWIVRGLLLLALPWWILGSDPLSLTMLPRLLFTLMLAYFSLVLYGLVRGKSPLIIALSGPRGFWSRAWFFLGPLLALVLGAIVLMDILGYRYGSKRLALIVLQTFGAALVIAVFYRVLINVATRASQRLRYRRDEGTDAAEARKLSEEVFNKVTRFAGLVAVTATVVFLAGFWGISDTVRSLFDSVHLYTIDADAGRFVSLWDAIAAVLMVATGHLVVSNLPALYEVLVFSRIEKTDAGTRFVIMTVTKYIITVIAYSAAVLTLNISFASLGYVFAALSVGLGFGLQEIVSNFVSGLILFFERPVRVGDFVSVGDTLGTVEKISIRATEVLSLDRQVIIIPNRMFITEQVVNWSHNDPYIRNTINVGVKYGSDVEKVRRVLREIVEAHPGVRKNPKPDILMLEFGDSSLNFVVRAYTLIDTRWTVVHEINSEITRRFAAQDIEIPFPQHDLHLRSVQDPRVIEAFLTRDAMVHGGPAEEEEPGPAPDEDKS
jgi:small-conductance mechanosensitive channel